jgi:CheY-like chemotaxis protein
MMRKILSHQMEQLGFSRTNLVMAADGNEAVARFAEGEAAANKRFDLLMLDCNMPYLSGKIRKEQVWLIYKYYKGPEVLARIRAAESNAGAMNNVPCIMHSAGLLDEGVIARLGGRLVFFFLFISS